ncbi:uncharacterized protein LOC110459555 isoform X1 [Mizuhopecten yessoensis]|uniref:uncharacterized protein LOC110459555 isoform X1 n=1 Tax=Mizuhopecten yessoensis TaxID=6573 RepID=UPI000B45F512|nr:uncharacterized protein LOC110459555 isoform X1 [Mizuhopecten yessoensis]
MACQDHEGKQKIMVCASCNIAVCEICIETRHYGHRLNTLKTAANTVVSDLKKLTENPCFTTLEKDLGDLSTLRRRESEKAVKTKQELLDRRDELKQVLDEVTETAVTKLDQHNENLFKELDEAKDKAMEQSQKVSDFKSEVERLQSSQNYLKVVEEGMKIQTPEISPLVFPRVSRLIFQSAMSGYATNIEMLFGELVQQDLYALTTFHPDGAFYTPVLGHYNPNPSPMSSICSVDLFGDGPDGAISNHTQQTDSTEVPTHLKLTQNAQSFKCDVILTHKCSFKLHSCPKVMKPTAECYCWIRHIEGVNTITLVSTNGDVMKSVTCTTKVYDILSLPNQLLFTTNKKCIRQMAMEKGKYTLSSSKWIDTDSFTPHCMCVTSNGDILVTMTDKTSWSIDPNSTSVLVKYSSKGTELARAHKDGHGQDLFFVPTNISTSDTGTVAVVNITGLVPQASHLMVLNNSLNLTHRYIWHGLTVPAEEQLPELTEKFRITHVLFNHLGLLIISELYSRTVQLLDPKCNLLKVLVTDLHDSPCSLALHADGDMWVGLQDGTVNVYKHTCDFTSEEP